MRHPRQPSRLEAVLADVRRAGVDRIVVGGDVVPGPMPRETMDCLRDLDIPAQFIQGNGDREVLNLMRGLETGAIPEQFLAAVRWNAQQLGAEDERRIAGWSATLRIDVPEVGSVLFCDATPRAGSVGMPFGEPGAYWLLIDSRVELRRTAYDVTQAAARIRATAYPQAEEFAARNVVSPPREQDMLDVFSRAELK